MNRGHFLKRAGLVLGGVVLGRALPLEAPAEAAPNTLWYHVGEETWSPNLVATGGLCAPLSPIYDMPSFPVRMSEVIPPFRAQRGGLR